MNYEDGLRGSPTSSRHRHENVVNFSLERELVGSRRLGTRDHRYVAATVAARQQRPASCSISSSSSSNSPACSTPRDLLASDHFTQRLPRVLVEREFDLIGSRINKIFCGQWIDERRCLLGTKCNKLVLLDTLTGMYSVQSPLKSHPTSRNIPDHCGKFF